jgi:hypothetical protein
MPLSKNFTAGFQLVNGWNNVEDTNSGKTMGFTTNPTLGKFAWRNNYYVGPEKANTNQGFRHFYDTIMTFNPSDKVSTYVNFDYGTEKFAGNRGRNDWIAIGGAAGLLTRLEFRRDWSKQPVFERGAVPNATKGQNTILIGVVAYFGPKR